MSLVANNGIPGKTELLNRVIPIWLRVAGSLARTCWVIRLKPTRASLTTFGVAVYVQLIDASRLSTGVDWPLPKFPAPSPPRGVHGTGIGPEESFRDSVLRPYVFVHIGAELILGELERARKGKESELARGPLPARNEKAAVLTFDI